MFPSHNSSKPTTILLLKEHSNKMSQVTPCSTIDQSSLSPQQRSCFLQYTGVNGDPQVGKMQTGRDRNTQSYAGCLHQIPLLRTQGSMWKKKPETLRAGGGDWLQGNSVFIYTREVTDTWVHRDCGSMHQTGTDRFSWMGSQHWERRVDKPFVCLFYFALILIFHLI